MEYTASFEFVDTRSDIGEFYNIEAEYHFVIEDNYGADADGNRGAEQAFLEDYSFEIFNELGENLTQQIKEKDNELYKSMEDYVEAESEHVDVYSLQERE